MIHVCRVSTYYGEFGPDQTVLEPYTDECFPIFAWGPARYLNCSMKIYVAGGLFCHEKGCGIQLDKVGNRLPVYSDDHPLNGYQQKQTTTDSYETL